MSKETDLEFFEQRVFKPETPCWNWRSYINRKGYGTWRRDGINTYVHRIAYALLVGPIPEGFEVHHKCCNRSCVNPEHLELVTHLENMAEVAKLRTHCKHSHEYTEENTLITSRGRVCRTCRTAAGRVGSERYRRKMGRVEIAKFCKNGHPRTPENTEIRGGHRRCRLCRIEGKRKPGGYKDPNRVRSTHCPHGHEWTPENTYVYGNGYRMCRACGREKAKARSASR